MYVTSIRNEEDLFGAEVLDRDDTGTVSLEEFVGASLKLHAPARMADRAPRPLDIEDDSYIYDILSYNVLSSYILLDHMI